MGRRAWGLGAVVAVLLLACAPAAHAGTGTVVGNPGPFNAAIPTATLSLGSFSDVSILPPGTTIGIQGQVGASGAINVPASGITFPEIKVTSPVNVTVTTSATTPGTGSINPQTGALTLNTQIQVVASIGTDNPPATCTFGPISLQLTTGTSGTITGAAYSDVTGAFSLVDGAANVPPGTGAPLCAFINSILGLGPSGRPAAMRLTGSVSPVLVSPGAPVPPPAPPPPPQTPPVCPDATVTVDTDTDTTIDLSCTGPVTERAITTPPQHGTLSAIDQLNGTVVYTPQPGFTGTDSFTFTATNRAGSTTATVTISVVPQPPTCRNAVVLTEENTPVTIRLRCTPPVDSYAIVNGPARGSLGPINQRTGTVRYTPRHNTSGIDGFTFTAQDSGGVSQPARVRIAVHPAPDVRIVNRRAPVRGGVAAVRLRCERFSLIPCRGVLSLRGRDGIAFTGASGPLATLGTARYVIRPGRARTVRVPLTARARMTLVASRRMGARAITRTRRPGERPRVASRAIVLIGR